MSPLSPITHLDGLALSRGLLEIISRRELAGSEDPIEAVLGVDLAIQTARLLGFEKLKPVKRAFPENIQMLMARPGAAVEADRDAFVESHDYLGFVEFLDMISKRELDCIAPHIHRGWQDKVQSCREVRRVAIQSVNWSLSEETRDTLLTALAIRQRVFAVSAPVLISTPDLNASLAILLDLIEQLTPQSQTEIVKLTEKLKKSLR